MGEKVVNLSSGPDVSAGIRVHSQPTFGPRVEVRTTGAWLDLSATESAAMLTAAQDSTTEWDLWSVATFGSVTTESIALRDDVLALHAWPGSGTAYAQVHVGDLGVERTDALTQSAHSAAAAGGSAWASALASSLLAPVSGDTVEAVRQIVLAAASF
jgi:hypothetical protein